MIKRLRLALFFVLFVVILLVSGVVTSSLAQTSRPLRIRIAVNPSLIGMTPFYYAMEKGYFKAEGLDVEVLKHRTSAAEMIPVLVRGDVDLMQLTAAPATFNAVAQGFKIRLVSVVIECKEGSSSAASLMVRKDLWDSGAIKQLKDMKGKKVDAGPLGTNVQLMTTVALERAGLTKNDVILTNKARTPEDMATLLREKVVDIQATTEPLATSLQEQGIAVKWFSMNELTPWFQNQFMGASEQGIRERGEAIKRFLKVFIRTSREIQKTNSWTPDVLKAAAKWTDMDEKVIKDMGPMPYMNPNAQISPESLSKVQNYWVKEGLLKQTLDVKNQLIDTSLLEGVLKELSSGR